MNRSVTRGVILVSLVVIFTVGLSGAVAGSDGIGDATMSPLSLQASDHSVQPTLSPDGDADSQEFDTTTFEITVFENGTATWTFRHERLLADSETAEFEQFAEEFETAETEFYTNFRRQATALADAGAAQTDREMEATNFNRQATIEHRPNPTGVVELSFTWSAFATVDGDRVIVGDVFDRMYLASDQTLIIAPGEDLAFTDATPEGEYAAGTLENASSVTWSGEEEFIDGHPRVEFERTTDAPAGETGTNPSVSENPLTAVGILIFGSLLIGGVLLWKRSRDTPETHHEPLEQQAAPAETPPAPDAQLLTDEDRVITLIEQNGGRMKQVKIVDETEWSKSKVSMLLSEMEAEGTISKLRVGRENIISLEGFEPEAAKSPFEE